MEVSMPAPVLVATALLVVVIALRAWERRALV